MNNRALICAVIVVVAMALWAMYRHRSIHESFSSAPASAPAPNRNEALSLLGGLAREILDTGKVVVPSIRTHKVDVLGKVSRTPDTESVPVTTTAPVAISGELTTGQLTTQAISSPAGQFKFTLGPANEVMINQAGMQFNADHKTRVKIDGSGAAGIQHRREGF